MGNHELIVHMCRARFRNQLDSMRSCIVLTYQKVEVTSAVQTFSKMLTCERGSGEETRRIKLSFIYPQHGKFLGRVGI